MGVKEELRSGFLSASAYIALKGLANFAVSEIGKMWIVDNELRKLERAVARIRVMIECVEAARCFSGENIKKAWQLWLEDLNILSYISGDILEEVSTLLDSHTMSELATETSSSLPPTTFKEQPSLRSEILSSGKLDLPHKIVKLREMLEDLATEMDTVLNFEALKSAKTTKVVTYSGSTSLVDESLVVGRESQKAHIVAKLLPDANHSLSSISIIGMGGLGKTTLAQVVYNDDEVQNCFQRKIWVSVSRDFDVTRVTRSIIESITRQSCTVMDLQSLQMKVQELLSFQRFLLILDDLWTENYTDWEVFSAPLRFGAQGNRIIITTRSRIVSDMVGSYPYLLPFLLDRDCWSLIRQRANVEDNVGAEENIDAVGLEMAKKCDGLPLAAKVLGNTLKDIHFKHWDSILKSNLWDLTSCRCDIFSSLALSYYDLPKELMKCFAYCALFPAKHTFEEEKLVLLWLAEGLIQPMGERSLLCIGKQYFKDLVGWSFFYSNPKKKNIYRMHGFFHQMARFVSSDIALQIKGESLACYPSLKNIRHLSFFCSNLFSDDFVNAFPKCERLRTFLLICRNDVQGVGHRADSLLTKFYMLRVVDLSEGHITVLSKRIANLKHLRYLNLSGNPLEHISECIDELFYLQTIMLNRCIRLISLPDSLRNLGNLKHLQFYECKKILHMPSELAERVDLQTLSTFVVGQDEGYTIVELKKMAFLRGSLQLFRLENVIDENQVIEANLHMMLWLEELELEWTAITNNMIPAESVLIHIQVHENLKKLAITGYCGLVFPHHWLRVSGFNLKIIHLKACSLCLSLPFLGHLQFLESLCIEEMPAVETVEAAFFEGFPSLKFLEFRKMVGLRRWSNLVPGCMPSLHVLICKECLSLVSLPSLGMIRSLTILKIKRCPSIMSLPEMLPVSLQKLDVRKSTILEQVYEEVQAEAEAQAQQAAQAAAQVEAQEAPPQPQADAQPQAEAQDAEARELWRRARAIPGLRIVAN